MLRKLLPSRTPMIFQTEIAECGVSCLLMIMKHHGVNANNRQLRSFFPKIARGASLLEVAKVATHFGFSYRAFNLPGAALIHEVETPFIAHWRNNHFVVVVGNRNGNVKVHDPAEGAITLSVSEFDSYFCGTALELKKNLDHERSISNTFQSSIKIIFNILRDNIKIVRESLKIFLLSLLLCAFALAAPFYGKVVIDKIILEGATPLFPLVTFAFLILMALEVLTRYIRTVSTLTLSSKVNLCLNDGIYKKLLSLPITYFQNRSSADVLSRINSIYSIRNAISANIISMAIDAVLIFISVPLILFVSPLLTLYTAGTAVLYAFLCVMILSYLKELTDSALVVKAKQDSYLLESIESISTIKVANIYKTRVSGFKERVLDTLGVDIKLGMFFAHLTFFEVAVLGIQNIVLLFAASQMAVKNVLSVGDIFLYMAFNTRIFSSVKSLVDNYMGLAEVEVHADRLSDILDSKDDTETFFPASKPNTHITERDLMVDNITFSYLEGDQPVISNLSFTVPHHETTVVTGPSGCGKSTLLNCLITLCRPNSGQITIGNYDIFELESYRDSISAVLQTDRLLGGSLLENITLFAEEVDMEYVIESASMACIHDIISGFPMGYHTPVKHLHSTISAGQIQRILLARALYRRPKILFLDEATCHLDEALEAEINSNIERLSLTKVVVTHRAGIIEAASNLVLLCPVTGLQHQSAVLA